MAATLTTDHPGRFRTADELTPQQVLKRTLNNYSGHRNTETVIPTAFVGPVLRDAIEQQNRELSQDGSKGEKQGAIQIVAERAAMTLGVQHDAALRRIFATTREEYGSITARHADAFLLACDINYTCDTDLPELPAGLAAAEEMVDCYFEYDSEEEPDPETRREFARLLSRFSTAFLNADRVIDFLESGALDEMEEAA
jgi:hypothetical protein